MANIEKQTIATRGGGAAKRVKYHRVRKYELGGMQTMSKKRIPDSFDAEATERLADLMRQTTDWKGHNIGLQWQFKMKLSS